MTAPRVEGVLVSRLVQLRTSIRRAEFGNLWPNNWDTGGCARVSEELDHRYGWPLDGGCYRPTQGERHVGKHIEHLWNVLPDGRILDTTADQFDGSIGVRIVPADDPRYLPDCDGESCNDGKGPA